MNTSTNCQGKKWINLTKHNSTQQLVIVIESKHCCSIEGYEEKKNSRKAIYLRK